DDHLTLTVKLLDGGGTAIATGSADLMEDVVHAAANANLTAWPADIVGTVNGTNTDFRPPEACYPETLKVYRDGLRMLLGSGATPNDYIVFNDGTYDWVRFTVPPPLDSIIVIDYGLDISA
ncbi:MAG: hypothetical protein QM642_07550, partial [Edaphocola sp.]